MSTTLVIRDGDPHWWNSPDIWVVPGNDPNGPPGQPVAGEPAFLWARVQDRGEVGVSGARVDFYWSNPAAGVLRSNSTLVGSAFVDLNPGESKNVLCVIPWIPVVVNGGHECVVAEVIHASDPITPPVPDAFDPPIYHQIAQKNLSVLEVSSTMLVLTIQAAAPIREERTLVLAAEVGEALDQDVLTHAGLKGYRAAKGTSPAARLSLEPGCDGEGADEFGKKLKLSLKPGTARAVYLKILPEEIAPRTYIPLHVIARDGQQRVLGGITYALVRAREE